VYSKQIRISSKVQGINFYPLFRSYKLLKNTTFE
jgi:hypothetical protein